MAVKIRFLLLLSLSVLGFGLSGCETIEGAGRDIEHAGQSIENAAD
jgi:predicted small secreted protein